MHPTFHRVQQDPSVLSAHCAHKLLTKLKEKEKRKNERTDEVKDERSNYLPLIGAYNKREISLSLQPPS